MLGRFCCNVLEIIIVLKRVQIIRIHLGRIYFGLYYYSEIYLLDFLSVP
jgi:hypothetical protein